MASHALSYCSAGTKSRCCPALTPLREKPEPHDRQLGHPLSHNNSRHSRSAPNTPPYPPGSHYMSGSLALLASVGSLSSASGQGNEPLYVFPAFREPRSTVVPLTLSRATRKLGIYPKS